MYLEQTLSKGIQLTFLSILSISKSPYSLGIKFTLIKLQFHQPNNFINIQISCLTTFDYLIRLRDLCMQYAILLTRNKETNNKLY